MENNVNQIVLYSIIFKSKVVLNGIIDNKGDNDVDNNNYDSKDDND